VKTFGESVHSVETAVIVRRNWNTNDSMKNRSEADIQENLVKDISLDPSILLRDEEETAWARIIVK